MSLIKVSASQVKTFDLCARKWAFDKIDKRPRTQDINQAFGTETHEVLEHYLGTGELEGAADVLATVKKGIQYLPAPSDDLDLEAYFAFSIEDLGVTVIGYIDVRYPGSTRVLVIDHKTTKDIRWAMNEEELRRDPQAIIYAVDAMTRFGVDEVECRWVYYVARPNTKAADGRPRTPGKPRQVSTVFRKGEPDFIENWNKVRATMKAIADTRRTAKRAMDVEPTPTSCSAFGGCQFIDDCKITAAQSMAAHLRQFDRAHGHKTPTKENGMSDVMEKLKALKKNKPALEPPAEEKPEVEPAPPEEKAEKPVQAAPTDGRKTLMEKLAGLKKSAGINPPESAEPGKAEEQTLSEAHKDSEVEEYVDLTADGPDDVHPDWQSEDERHVVPCPKCGAFAGQVCVTGKGKPSKRTHGERIQAFENYQEAGLGVAGVTTGRIPSDAPNESSPPTSAAAQEASEKHTVADAVFRTEKEGDGYVATHEESGCVGQGKTRQEALDDCIAKLALYRAPDDEPSPVDVTSAPEPVFGGKVVRERIGEVEREVIDTSGMLFVVLVDCLPVKGMAATPIEHLVEDEEAKVAEANDVSHWGLIEYAKGAPTLQVMVAAAWKAERPTGVFLLDSFTNIGKALLPVVTREADILIRGVRG